MFQLAEANHKVIRVRNAAIAAIGVLATATIPAGANFQPRVIGGDVASPAMWPAAVALVNESGQFCGGTLIGRRQVLTAKHCVYGPLDPTLEAVVGRPDLSDAADGREIRVTARHRHPNADLAVLDLATGSPETPFPIATRRQDRAATEPGDLLRVAGWGSTRPRGGLPSDVLREAKQFAKRGRRCRLAYSFYENRTMICALGRKLSRDQYASACYGDSGGPLVADTLAGRVLVGAVSGGGFRCGNPRQPPYYTRVAAFRSWILDHLRPEASRRGR